MDQFSQRTNLGMTMCMHSEDDLISKRDCTSNLFSLNNQWYVYVCMETFLFSSNSSLIFTYWYLCQGTEKVGLRRRLSATCHYIIWSTGMLWSAHSLGNSYLTIIYQSTACVHACTLHRAMDRVTACAGCAVWNVGWNELNLLLLGQLYALGSIK